MRKRFEQQLKIGQRPIEDTPIDPKSKNALMELLAALKEIYCDKSYNERLFDILETQFASRKIGRPGMDLWTVFVLAQLRLCKNLSYGDLHDQANNHKTLRQLIGVEYEYGYESPEFSYNTIYDNVSMLDDSVISDINSLIVEFGHNKIFKKKEKDFLELKSDSFVVESNVHFPTDYNLLWDCQRKMMDIVAWFTDKYPDIKGWRKLKLWRRELKNLTRSMGRASASGGKNKVDREKQAAKELIEKACLLVKKVEAVDFLYSTEIELAKLVELDYFKTYAIKHIDLLERRVLKDEKIPHSEKIFSVFETYTEWVNKGKSRPNIELGKKLCITSDQFNLIVDYQIMEHQQDKDTTLEIAQRIIDKFNVRSWSFDKGYWDKTDKELLGLYIDKVVMPKKGKLSKEEYAEESAKDFKKLRNSHSAVESNINELEHRGADRCPDKGWDHFKRYVGLSICAYNLKKIGHEIVEKQRQEIKKMKSKAAA